MMQRVDAVLARGTISPAAESAMPVVIVRPRAKHFADALAPAR
jgi:hypothetical protein